MTACSLHNTDNKYYITKNVISVIWRLQMQPAKLKSTRQQYQYLNHDRQTSCIKYTKASTDVLL